MGCLLLYHGYQPQLNKNRITEYPAFYFHDFVSLLKTKYGWKIACKMFYLEEKQK